MFLDRAFQLELLATLSKIYPNHYNFNKQYPSDSTNYHKALANIYYLKEHGLITAESILDRAYLGGECVYHLSTGRITKDGLDLLADDGGLKAILNTITVKFDAAQMARLLLSFDQLGHKDKQSLLHTLKNAPQTTLDHLIGKAVNMGWDFVLGTALP
ncbi:hypothetical protein [Moraxella catarrhalis]|uniref:hypothetical protein n=1 Tax=Moraxella catarrhalis TaxID=480 RepID=UPI000202AED6|nr:hypothetical protein [Moraxella catarrhalis]EGE09629.1 hypothetical protein E9M_09189 [Moraxella catarrhalis 46P47B1]MPW68239.1 hypothetical protein [Moraxella catarrhalis]MPX57161.1 hypothetical protein [Moraxella catarrhalis]